MRQVLLNLLRESNHLSVEEIILHMIIATIIGGVIYISYSYTHSGTIYSRKFAVSLILLTILTATVMTVIANNVALSLGMVGALSIVRFRTAIKDSRDTIYIFWAIVAGICCGAGEYLIGAMGTATLFMVLIFMGRVKNDSRVLLIIRGTRDCEMQAESIVFQYYKAKAILKVKNTSPETVEFIYEISRKIADKALKNEKSLTDLMYELNGIEYVNLVTQSDDIHM